LIKAAPLRFAAPGLARGGLRPWGPTRRGGPGIQAPVHWSDKLISSFRSAPGMMASSSGCQCPNRGTAARAA